MIAPLFWGLIAAAASVALTKLWREWLRYWYYYFSPVAYPGGPHPERLARRGKWEDRETSLEPGWVFLHAESSHEFSNAEFPSAKMTGEPAGRQTWAKLGGTGPAADIVAGVAAAAAPAPVQPPRRPSLFGLGAQPAPAPPPPDLSFNPGKNPNSSDKVLRGQHLARWRGPRPDESLAPSNAAQAAKKGVEFYQMIQCEDGHWAGDYGGPMFLMPGVLIAFYVTGQPLPESKRAALETYLRNHQQVDGGWGTHIESPSTMFGSVMCYVALRLLGVAPNDPAAARARQFIRDNGGAVMTSSWAKFWLSLLGAHDWAGINSIPPELWMLPRWFPFHPGRLWCHCRMVYLPMSYLYGLRFSHDAAADPTVAALREELYLQPYDKIDWDATRHAVSPLDAYSPIHPLMRLLQNLLAMYERFVLPFAPALRYARRRGVRFAGEYMHEEDLQTNFVDIGPVSKPLNWLCAWLEAGRNRSAENVVKHVQRADDYFWLAEDGMKVQGYNGSQCWDTSFALQAIAEAGLAPDFPECCRKGWRYLERTQIASDEERRDLFFRHISKGGWPFSTAAHGWPISDCTSEGLKAVLALLNEVSGLETEAKDGRLPAISEERLCGAVNVLLSYQNHDGGWATYENNRGYGWFEWLNPSEVFGDIMIDYSYVECSSACVTAFNAFRARYPTHRAEEIQTAIERGQRFVRSIQRPDGSWYGSWGVCFTYGTWFGIKCLRAAGATPADFDLARAVTFLLARQNPNGGWGESYVACVDKAYPQFPQTKSVDGPDLGTDGSGVVQTAWGMLGLMASGAWDPAERPRHELLDSAQPSAIREALDKAAKFLMSKQLPSGDWAQEGITGVFNRSTGITYTAYRNVFPIWALGVYARLPKV